LERKKAWADLEREQAEVQRNIKTLMKLEPGSRVMNDNPMLADRVQNVRMDPHTYETVEDKTIQKRMEQLDLDVEVNTD